MIFFIFTISKKFKKNFTNFEEKLIKKNISFDKLSFIIFDYFITNI